MLPLDDKEEAKLQPQETIAEKIKWNPWKRKNAGARLTVLTPNKLLTRLPLPLAQIKAGKTSCKLKNKMRQILYLLYQHNKITNKVYNNLIKSL